MIDFPVSRTFRNGFIEQGLIDGEYVKLPLPKEVGYPKDDTHSDLCTCGSCFAEIATELDRDTGRKGGPQPRPKWREEMDSLQRTIRALQIKVQGLEKQRPSNLRSQQGKTPRKGAGIILDGQSNSESQSPGEVPSDISSN